MVREESKMTYDATMNNPKPLITHDQMSILGAYKRALAGRDPLAVADSDILAAMQAEVPGVTSADIADALRAERNRVLTIFLRDAPVGLPN
jgi:hypothetical protein